MGRVDVAREKVGRNGQQPDVLGGAMSQVENTLALAVMLRRFQPEYVGPLPAGINATVTLTPRGGLPFKVRRLAA